MLDEPISKFMKRDVLCGPPDALLLDVLRRMDREGQSAFVVCADEVPIGVITERDVVTMLSRVLEGSERRERFARDIMTHPVHTLPETESMSEVVRIMRERGFRRVPIVGNDGRIAGIVNIGELQNATTAALERRGRDLEETVLERTSELRAANEKLRELTRQDGLTSLLNRRAMEERIDEYHALAARHGNVYSVILLDIDHFKRFNDSQGHLAGDDVLRRIAVLLRESVRRSDSVFRYGGEEFLILLPETDAAHARIAADRILRRVAADGIPHPASPTRPHVTVSMGFTDVDTREKAGATTWQDVVRRADQALYAAKQAGRDRALAWEPAS